MSPQKQAAQIANAQKSRGATTEAGRARSSQNSIRHSLCSKKYFIVPEERPEFDIYYNNLIAALAPEGASEALLAEAIILDAWRLTRARLVENQVFFGGYMSAKQRLAAGAETWLAHSKELSTLTLYEQRINRVLTRNKAEFASIQFARSGADLPACGTPVPHPGALPTTQSQVLEAPQFPAQPTEPKPEVTTPARPAGFVHSSDASAPHSAELAEPKPETAAPARPAGFVHSSDASAPLSAGLAEPKSETAAPARPLGFVHSSDASAPLSAEAAETNPETAAPEQPAGFVHSSDVSAPNSQLLAKLPPAPSARRPAAARRAA